ncbi:MAG: hypothetical protein JWL75_761 [Parcubacteria group bacterium]|nr:hypothetical protein [Parcubacteria group bacterium]
MIALQPRLASLNAYDFGFLRERYSEDHPKYAPFFDEAASELRKFYELVLSSNGPLAVLSKKVDELWHTHVLHTPQYRAFSSQVLGDYIDHQPHSELTPVPGAAITNFYREYTDRFGSVPSIWTEDIPVAHMADLRRGKVPAAMLEMRWSGWPGK